MPLWQMMAADLFFGRQDCVPKRAYTSHHLASILNKCRRSADQKHHYCMLFQRVALYDIPCDITLPAVLSGMLSAPFV